MSQTRTNLNNVSGVKGPGDVRTRVGVTIAQYTDFNKDVAEFTVIAKTATGTYKIMTANDGTEWPIGLLRGTIPEADIEGGNVTNQILYVFGKDFDEGKIVLENSLTLNTAIPFFAATGPDLTIREALQMNGILTRTVDAIAGYENS